MQESFGMQNLTPKMYGESNTSGGKIQMEKKKLVKKSFKRGKGKSKSKSKSPTTKLRLNLNVNSPDTDIKEKVVNKVMKSKMVDTSLSYQKYASKKVTDQNLNQKAFELKDKGQSKKEEDLRKYKLNTSINSRKFNKQILNKSPKKQYGTYAYPSPRGPEDDNL